MEIGIAIILGIAVIIAYVIIQETRARLHWRMLVNGGDLTAITALTEGQVEVWRRGKVPKGTPLNLWRGVQSIEVLAITPETLHVSSNAEGLYALVAGVRQETSSPLTEGFKLTARLADMLLYEIPDVKFESVRIDVFSTFRSETGDSAQRCILTTTATREAAEDLDWEGSSADEIVRAFDGRYSLNDHGVGVPIEPDPPQPADPVVVAAAG